MKAAFLTDDRNMFQEAMMGVDATQLNEVAPTIAHGLSTKQFSDWEPK